MRNLRNKQRGVGVIEVLISIVVLAIGLLSVAVLHNNIIEQSHENKARSEAIAIAQQRLEQMRNYSDAVTDEGEFNQLFTNITKGNSVNVTGTNAVFTRTETIGDSNDVKELTVSVNWADRKGDTQAVTLDSAVGWNSPRSVGDLATPLDEPLIPSATGRARLGEGILTDYPSAVPVKTNNDLTAIYNTLDGNLRLAINDTDRTIVLTLEDACEIDGSNCTDFVEISGRVYIDRATQSKLGAGDVYVKASDAAFCQRYYDNNGTVTEVTADTTRANLSTPNSDYNYFDYTCYLGGGWHGNIGIIIEGGISQSDKICQGDPTSINAWEQPEIAARRVYRGMSYKKSEATYNGDGELVVSTYYTIGVGDAVKLPDDVADEGSHDFVIARLTPGDTEGSKCISEGIMTRDDSAAGTAVKGTLFAKSPTDFYCLNTADKALVDLVNQPLYDIEEHCPFDPSDPPSLEHQITGAVYVNSGLDNTLDILSTTFVNTSDGLGNCYMKDIANPSTDYYVIPYVCSVYDWGSGWNGYVQVNTDFSSLSCEPYREDFTVITGDTAASGHKCTAGSILTIAGTVNTSSKKVLTVATTSDGLCEVAADGLSYGCFSSLLGEGELWTGTLNFTSSNGSKLCIADPVLVEGTFSIIDGTGTSASITFTNVNSTAIKLALDVVGSKDTCP